MPTIREEVIDTVTEYLADGFLLSEAIEEAADEFDRKQSEVETWWEDREQDGWDAGDFADALRDVLDDSDDVEVCEWTVSTFDDEGLLTADKGLVIQTPQGQFQVTIVRSSV